MIREIDITEIEGFYLGHSTDAEAGTGCTVIISENGAACGADYRGGGPASRESELLRPENMVQQINAVALSGGSAFGLAAADGVMQYLRDRGFGFATGYGVVPIVCGASLFDLGVGSSDRFPDSKMGYDACVDAFANGVLEQGNFGAGTGATCGKLFGGERCMKSGLGTYAVDIDGVKVGAVVAVNCFGDIFSEDGKRIAGLLNEEGDGLESTAQLMMNNVKAKTDAFNENTSIGCVITNARLTKAQCCKLSQISHDGLARAIKPVHTSADGDAIFVMSSGDAEADFDAIGVLCAEVVQKAVINGILNAESAYGYIASEDIL